MNIPELVPMNGSLLAGSWDLVSKTSNQVNYSQLETRGYDATIARMACNECTWIEDRMTCTLAKGKRHRIEQDGFGLNTKTVEGQQSLQ